MRPGTAARRITAWALGAALASHAAVASGDDLRRPAAPRSKAEQAAPGGSPAPAAAEALLREGRRLLAEGRLDEACARMAAAQKADPTASTATALGDCMRRGGKVAGARAAYDEARTLGKRAADEAEARLRDLDDGQPRVMILAPAGLAAGTSIRLDGIPIDPAALGVAFPVQPGDHLLEVTRGASRWSTRVEVEAAGTARVEIPAVDGEGPPAAPKAAPVDTQVATDEPRSPSKDAEKGAEARAAGAEATPAPAPRKGPPIRWEAHRISGVVIGGAGVITLVTGAVFGVQAVVKKSASNDGHCSASDICDATGRSLRADAMRAGNVATVTLFAGGAAVASGLAIFFTAPANVPAKTTERIGLGVGPGALRILGRW